MLVGIGGWFIGMRSLVSNIVTEDYVIYAELAGVERRRILPSYVMRNALVPQVTGLAMSLGAIFNGAIITEQVFGYPGIGTLLVSTPSMPATTAWCSASPRSRSSAVSLGGAADRPSLSAARSPGQGALSDGRTILRSPALQSPNSRIGVVPGRPSSRAVACLSFFSPYPPQRQLSSCRPTCRRRWDYPFGTTSRGQDVFWQLTFAIRNTLLFGITVARPEPHPLARRSAWSPATRAGWSTAC